MSHEHSERENNDLQEHGGGLDRPDQSGSTSPFDAGRPELGRIRSGRHTGMPKEGAAPPPDDYAPMEDDDDLPPLVIGEDKTTGMRGSHRLLTLIILLLFVGATVGAAVYIWNKRQVERRAAAILADMENTGGDEADSGALGGAGDRRPGGLDLRWPVIDEISSPYGYRVHPISKERKLHNGIDIAAPYWKEVFAAGNGKVVWSGRKGGKGNTVIIRHNKTYETVYCHLQKCKVKKGEEVIKGDLIGWVGSTGYSRGPHLHLELHKNGTPVDPAPYLPEPTEAMLKRLKEKGIETLSD